MFNRSNCEYCEYSGILTEPLNSRGVEDKTVLKPTLLQWPNLKNLSGGLNLSRGLNMVGSTTNCIKCFKI